MSNTILVSLLIIIIIMLIVMLFGGGTYGITNVLKMLIYSFIPIAIIMAYHRSLVINSVEKTEATKNIERVFEDLRQQTSIPQSNMMGGGQPNMIGGHLQPIEQPQSVYNPPIQQPIYSQPSIQQPMYVQPPIQQPMYSQPQSIQQPIYAQPQMVERQVDQQSTFKSAGTKADELFAQRSRPISHKSIMRK